MKRESLLQSMKLTFSDWEVTWKISWDLFNFSLFVWAQYLVFFFFLFLSVCHSMKEKHKTSRRWRLPSPDATSELWVCVRVRGSEHLIRRVKVPVVTSAGGTTSWKKRQQKEKIRLQKWKKSHLSNPTHAKHNAVSHARSAAQPIPPTQNSNQRTTRNRHAKRWRQRGWRAHRGSRCEKTHDNYTKYMSLTVCRYWTHP